VASVVIDRRGQRLADENDLLRPVVEIKACRRQDAEEKKKAGMETY
jgi:hypothetical protein